MLAALIVVAVIAILVLLVLSAAIKVLREYERGVIFRLGRLLGKPKGPGLIFLIPIIDRMVKVDLRTITLMIPPQEVITKDNVPARVNAVCYFRVVDASASVVQVENFMVATSQIAQTTLRSVLGQHSLDELLSEREKINSILQEIIDEATAPWGIKVSIVEVKDVEIPADMQRAMARQAEAERERRAKIINAEGEFQAAERLTGSGGRDGKGSHRAPAPLPPDVARDRRIQQLDDRLSRSDRPAQAVPRARREEERAELNGAARAAPRSAVRPPRRRRSRTGPSGPEPFRSSSRRLTRASSTSARSARAGRTGRRRRRCGCRPKATGRCASCRTSTPRSSGRRWSCTRRSTCARSPSFPASSWRSSRRRGAPAPLPRARRALPTSTRSSTRAKPPAQASRTRTRSSSGFASRRRPSRSRGRWTR